MTDQLTDTYELNNRQAASWECLFALDRRTEDYASDLMVGMTRLQLKALLTDIAARQFPGDAEDLASDMAYRAHKELLVPYDLVEEYFATEDVRGEFFAAAQDAHPDYFIR